jgi:hypothetical protein
LCVLVTTLSVQDRDGARPLLEQLTTSFRRIRVVWADAGYADKPVASAEEHIHLRLQTVK